MIQLYGFARSVYVRSVRLALEEKGLAYELTEVDPFVPGGPPAWYRELHPFGKIPAFRHDGLDLFESDAILRYLEAAWPDPPLFPTDPAAIARTTQVMRVMDNYGYRSMVWGVYVPMSRQVSRGEAVAEAQLERALGDSHRVLGVLGRLQPAGAAFLAGAELSLADTHAYPMFATFAAVAPGRAALEQYPELARWLAAMEQRSSVIATRPPKR